MMNELFPGAIVRLKSGGPLMTVTSSTVNSRIVECSWFHRFLWWKAPMTAKFHADALYVAGKFVGEKPEAKVNGAPKVTATHRHWGAAEDNAD